MNGVVTLIARREITARLQQKGYRIGLGIALLIVVGACILPSFFHGDHSTPSYDIALPAQATSLAEAVHSESGAAHVEVTVHDVTSLAQARAEVSAGHWDAALVGRRLVVQNADDRVAQIVEQAYADAQVTSRLQQAGLSDIQIEDALNPAPLTIATTAASTDTERRVIATIAVVALFSQLITFCTWVAMGVVEEKSSRVVELVLAAVRPMQLLAGKLIGIGILAVLQVLLLGVAALVSAKLAGTLTVTSSAIGTVLVALVGFVLGFAFFAALAAGLASTVSRQEEVSGMLAPVSISLTLCYGASFAVAGAGSSTLSRVLSIVPPISSMAMPARIARGGVPVLDIVLAIVLLAVTAGAMLAVGARIYRASVLHAGSRVPLRRAWRGEAVGGAG